MTHPDIKRAEIFGTDYYGTKRVIGKCEYCGGGVCDDDNEYVTSDEGIFCNVDCFFEYHGVEVVNNG